jgi:hypothetical protein
MQEIECGVDAFHGLQVHGLVKNKVLYKVWYSDRRNFSYVWKNDNGVWYFETRQKFEDKFINRFVTKIGA